MFSFKMTSLLCTTVVYLILEAHLVHGRTNFIVMNMDDLGWGDLGILGEPNKETPNIDRMASEGLLFTDFYAGAPLCSPSRAALLTGRLPIRNGFYTTNAHGRNAYAPQQIVGGIAGSEVLFPEILSAAGYKNKIVGKWHLGNREQFLPLKHGFHEFFGSTDTHFGPFDNVKVPNIAFFKNSLMIGRYYEEFKISRSGISNLTSLYIQEALDFLRDRSKDQMPFFLYWTPDGMHGPVFSSVEYRYTSRRGKYGDSVREVDQGVGQILDLLDSTGLSANTVVFFTSDNGPALIDKTAAGSNGPFLCGKQTTFEGGIRVPLIVRWTGKITPKVTNQVTRTTDIFPTILELAKLSAPKNVVLDGTSFVSHLFGGPKLELPAFFYRGNELFAVRYKMYKAHLWTWTNSLKQFQEGVDYCPGQSVPDVTTHDQTNRTLSPVLFELGIDPYERYPISPSLPEYKSALFIISRIIDEHRRKMVPGTPVLNWCDPAVQFWAPPGCSKLNKCLPIPPSKPYLLEPTTTSAEEVAETTTVSYNSTFSTGVSSESNNSVEVTEASAALDNSTQFAEITAVPSENNTTSTEYNNETDFTYTAFNDKTDFASAEYNNLTNSTSMVENATMSSTTDNNETTVSIVASTNSTMEPLTSNQVSTTSTEKNTVTESTSVSMTESSSVTSTEATTTTVNTFSATTSKSTMLSSSRRTLPTSATESSQITSVATTAAPVTYLPTVAPNFVRYPLSTDYYLSNLLDNATVIGVDSVRVVNGPFGFGSAVGLGYEGDTCLLLPLAGKANSISNTDSEARNSCLKNPANCDEGFSMSIWENVNFNIDDTEDRYVVSSGGDTEGTPGVALYHRGVDLHAVLSNGTHVWYVYAPGPVPNNTWSNIGIRWNSSSGLELYVDKARVAQVMYPTNSDVLSAKTPSESPQVTVGCQTNSSSNQTTHSKFLNAKFDELALWTRRLNDTELACFLGGYDAVGANMTARQLADIIRTKLNLTDPEQRKQAIVILLKMTDTTGEEAEALFTTPMPPPKVSTSSTTSVPYGNSSENTSTPSWTTLSTTTSPPVNSNEMSEVAQLQTIADIVGLMTNPDTLSQEVSQEQLADIHSIVTVVSNVFRAEEATEWHLLQQTKPGSPEVVTGMEAMAMAAIQRTHLTKRQNTLHMVTTSDNIVLTTDKMSVSVFEKMCGITVPNYTDPEWNNVPWSQGTKKLPVDTVSFSRELFSDLGRAPTSQVSVTTFVYDTYDQLVPMTVNTRHLPSRGLRIDSKVLSVLMEPFDGLDYNLYLHPVTVTLAHNTKEAVIRKLFFHDESKAMPSIKKRYCVSWDPNILPFGGWETTGCEMIHSNADYSICMCDKLGRFAIMAQTVYRKDVEPDPEWLIITKYVLYALSTICLIFYMAMILFSKYLKDQFHVVRFNLAIVTLTATACMFASDYVRDQRHECTAVSAVMHFGYVAVATWLMLDCHAVFAAILKGIVGGKLTAYYPIGYGVPLIFLGLALYGDMDDYGWEPRCMISWNDQLKWTLFAPVLILATVAIILAVVSIINISFAALKKETVFEDMGSTSKGLGIVTGAFAITWVFACLAYLDIELIYPDFYPIFQILNASLGLIIFIFAGLCSRKFRVVLGGGVPDTSYFPLMNECDAISELIPVKPQPKRGAK